MVLTLLSLMGRLSWPAQTPALYWDIPRDIAWLLLSEWENSPGDTGN